MTRRELTLMAAAAGALSAQTRTEPGYQGALEGYESKIKPSEFDPVAWTVERWKSAPLRLTFRAQNRKEAERWQRQLRAKVAELVGGLPERGPAPRAELLERREFPAYRRDKLIMETRPGVALLMYLLTPKGPAEPMPAVICIPGHGRGADDIVGIDEHGRDRSDKPGYQHDFAIQVAERGAAAIAIEPLAFGCRRDPLTRKKGLGATACQPSAGAALLFGETMIGWRVYDVIRTIDWIETRPELNGKRVGCMGISGGGTCSLFSTALDRRIRAAFVSGYLNIFRDCIMSLSHCMDNYVPGILNWAEMYDVAGLIAPRPLFSEGGDQDPIFPVAATRDSYARVKRVYEVFGAPDAVQQEIFEGVHEFHGVRGLPFLMEHLKA
jgi:dienelactone hydrolase